MFVECVTNETRSYIGYFLGFRFYSKYFDDPHKCSRNECLILMRPKPRKHCRAVVQSGDLLITIEKKHDQFLFLVNHQPTLELLLSTSSRSSWQQEGIRYCYTCPNSSLPLEVDVASAGLRYNLKSNPQTTTIFAIFLFLYHQNPRLGQMARGFISFSCSLLFKYLCELKCTCFSSIYPLNILCS